MSATGHAQAALLPLLTFSNLSAFGNVRHFVTTRQGGVSASPYDSLNLGLHTADNEADVLANRQLLAKAVGIPPEKFLYASQVHSGDVKIIDEQAVANGVLQHNPRTDATVTALPGICLMVMVADCVPLLLFDPARQVIAVVHAGWRGTVNHITRNTLKVMQDHFGCSPADIVAGIGPSIGPCCYEVGPDVQQVVEQQFGIADRYLVPNAATGKLHFDLWYANRRQLTDGGVPDAQIETMALCTFHHTGTLFSSRAAKGITGRFAAGICIQQ